MPRTPPEPPAPPQRRAGAARFACGSGYRGSGRPRRQARIRVARAVVPGRPRVRRERRLGEAEVVAEVGVDHIFYGTDYPFDWPVGVDFVLNAPFLTNAQKEQILGGNLIKLLRINT